MYHGGVDSSDASSDDTDILQDPAQDDGHERREEEFLRRTASENMRYQRGLFRPVGIEKKRRKPLHMCCERVQKREGVAERRAQRLQLLAARPLRLVACCSTGTCLSGLRQDTLSALRQDALRMTPEEKCKFIRACTVDTGARLLTACCCGVARQENVRF
jgi:hypothetical protein